MFSRPAVGDRIARLSRGRLFDALARTYPGEAQAIYSTTTKAHRSAAGEKGGARAQAIGRSRGRATKIHTIVDARGRA